MKPDGTSLINSLVNGSKQEDGTIKNKTITIIESHINGTSPVNNNAKSTDQAKADAENGIGTNSEVYSNPEHRSKSNI